MIKKVVAMMLSVGLLLTGFTTQVLAKEELSQVTDMWWDGEEIAEWEEIEEAYKYEVKLFRGSTEIASTKVSKPKYNFNSKMDKTGTYRFKVRALGKGDYSNSSWSSYSEGLELDSEAISNKKKQSTVTSTTTAGTGVTGVNGGPGTGQPTASWVQEGSLWWYRNADGSYPKAAWSLINEKWYFFDEAGYMKNGWINWNNQTYYCSADGAMLTGTQVIDGVGYQFQTSGALITQ